jgi:DNA-binding NarL/FixJ family response regulator
VTPTRVLVADDHAPTRRDIVATLRGDERFAVCAEAADAPSAVRMAIEHGPGLCLLDVRMPGSGISAAWEITARLPETRVVMLTVSVDDGDLFPALRAGASGYLLKDESTTGLGDALQRAVDAEATLSTALLHRVLDELRERHPRRRGLLAAPGREPLTSREWEVLDLLRRGAGTAEIARTLSVSNATVRSHIAGTLHKLGVADRAAAIAMFADR